MITNRSCSCGPPSGRSAEAVPGLSDEAHSRAATASTRSKVRVGARSNNSIQDLAAEGVPRSWQVRVPHVVADQGIRPGRRPFGTGRYYPVLGGCAHPARGTQAELACGASACTPVGQIIQALRRQHRPVAACAVPAQEKLPVRSTRYDARTAGPHRSHVWLISCLPAFGCAVPSWPDS